MKIGELLLSRTSYLFFVFLFCVIAFLFIPYFIFSFLFSLYIYLFSYYLSLFSCYICLFNSSFYLCLSYCLSLILPLWSCFVPSLFTVPFCHFSFLFTSFLFHYRILTPSISISPVLHEITVRIMFSFPLFSPRNFSTSLSLLIKFTLFKVTLSKKYRHREEIQAYRYRGFNDDIKMWIFFRAV
jgi:hypothetical protein